MKVIKNINNNVALCLDSNNKEVVAFAKGIGFKKPPYEIEISNVERTYYDVDEIYISMIDDLPEQIIKISSKIIDYARMRIENPISSNIVFTLADHINFSIKRYQQNMQIKLPIIYDIQHLYEKEMEIGQYGLKLIKDELKVYMPKEEAAYIALHIINAEGQTMNKIEVENDEVIRKITKIVEAEYQITINTDSFDYSRFVTHMHYLIKRGRKNELVRSENTQLYQQIVQGHPKTAQCSEKVSKYLSETLKIHLNDEEKLYLILHINRLCTREDCYQ